MRLLLLPQRLLKPLHGERLRRQAQPAQRFVYILLLYHVSAPPLKSAPTAGLCITVDAVHCVCKPMARIYHKRRRDNRNPFPRAAAKGAREFEYLLSLMSLRQLELGLVNR